MMAKAECRYQPPAPYYFFVPILAFVAALAALEAGLAIFHPVPYSIETNMYFEPDPYTGYRLKPGGVGHYQGGIHAVANSHGHRDVEVSLEKPPRKFRILVLGDSFTVGANVQQEESYPKVLEKHLRSSFGSRIQVVNAGVGGWQPFQYAQYFEYYGRGFEPDLILIGFFVGNDTFDTYTDPGQLNTAILGHRISREAAASPFIKLEIFLYDHSNLARLVLNRGPTAPSTFVRKQCDDFSEQYLSIQRDRISVHLRYKVEQRERARNAVHQIRRIQELAGGTPIVVALLPDENQINLALQKRVIPTVGIDQYDFNMPQSMLSEMLHEVDIPTIDVLPAMLADQRCLYMNDTHWLPVGHELAASVIAEGLLPILPPAPHVKRVHDP